MMYVDVDVEDSCEEAKELDDRQDDIVDVTESRGFGCLGMMQATSPVYRYVGSTAPKKPCAIDRTSYERFTTYVR